MLKRGGRFLCLEFSAVDVPGLDRVYEAFSFKVIPRMGKMIAGDAEPYRYLVESIRRFPGRRDLLGHDRRGGLPPRHRHAADRRGRHDPFGLEALRPRCWRPLRAYRPADPGRLRAGPRGRPSGHRPAQRPGRGPAPLALARMMARPPVGARRAGGSASPWASSGPPTSSSASSWRRGRTSSGRRRCATSKGLQDRVTPVPPRHRGRHHRGGLRPPDRPDLREFSEPVAAASVAQVHRARIHAGARRRRGGRQGHAARRRAALQARPRRPLLRGPTAERFCCRRPGA